MIRFLSAILIATYLTGFAQADDYLALTHEAYCVGATRRNVRLLDNYSLPSTGPSNLLMREQATVDGALKLGKLDPTSVSRLMESGELDAQYCSDEQERCGKEIGADAKRDSTLTSAQLAGRQSTCLRLSRDACSRVDDCK
jgi:hypothetical protein